MAACTAAIWGLTDRSKTGLGLGALLAVGAPLAEAVIVAFGLWHYDRLGLLFTLNFTPAAMSTFVFYALSYARYCAHPCTSSMQAALFGLTYALRLCVCPHYCMQQALR